METDRQDTGSQGAAMAMLWGIMLIVLFGGGWFLFRSQLTAVALSVGLGMAEFASVFTSRYDTLIPQLEDANPADASITFGRLWRMLTNIGAFYSIPVAIGALGLAIAVSRKVTNARWSKELDLNGLVAEQARTFRFNAPFVGREVKPVEPAEGPPRPLDPALHAPEWVRRFGRDERGNFNEWVAHASLAAQLGRVWEGPEAASPHVRCMFVAFALHAARRREDARDLLGDLAESLPRDPAEGAAGPAQYIAFSEDAVRSVDEMLMDPDFRACRAVARKHGFTAPAMMSVLTYARERAGVLNPGQFAFLQFVDRPLFMALNTLGFPTTNAAWHRGPAPTPTVEGIGARDHWQHELEAGCPLLVPMVRNALASIRADVGYTVH